MASCEKCWGDAYMRSRENPMKSQTEHYQDLIDERLTDPCSFEEQAGDGATICENCNRRTVHQYAKICTCCGIKPSVNE